MSAQAMRANPSKSPSGSMSGWVYLGLLGVVAAVLTVVLFQNGAQESFAPARDPSGHQYLEAPTIPVEQSPTN